MTKNTGSENMRYERKMAVTGRNLNTLRHMVRLHPAGFREIFHPRYVNNIYFDTPFFDSGLANIEGRRRRMKIRIRWYGHFYGPVLDACLEVKIKQDQLGTKALFPLPSFEMSDQFNPFNIRNLVRQVSLPEAFRIKAGAMIPVLVNSYHRTYFLSADGKFRLTLDHDLQWGSIHALGTGTIRQNRDFQTSVVELKYDRGNDDEAAAVTGGFPFRVTKNSKYLNALSRIYP